jgi:hypothetical protein
MCVHVLCPSMLEGCPGECWFPDACPNYECDKRRLRLSQYSMLALVGLSPVSSLKKLALESMRICVLKSDQIVITGVVYCMVKDWDRPGQASNFGTSVDDAIPIHNWDKRRDTSILLGATMSHTEFRNSPSLIVTGICMLVCVCICMCICMCVCMRNFRQFGHLKYARCMYVCMCLRMYLYGYIHVNSRACDLWIVIFEYLSSVDFEHVTCRYDFKNHSMFEMYWICIFERICIGPVDVLVQNL